mgnify:CR=1 FL=1
MPQMKIITGGGRRRWPDEDKLRVLEEAAQPGFRLSVAIAPGSRAEASVSRRATA